MSQPLVISAANLDVIETNLNNVASELSGVVANVNSVNTQMANVGNRVDQLNNDLQSLVKELRENTTITNARQAIMYNNDYIDKKYGYYSEVRRMTEGLIDSIERSTIKKSFLSNLREELVVNNPNYWLSNALSAVSLWILDDKDGADREVYNALKKDDVKTSIFFSLLNLRLKRETASINWLKVYLNKLNPLDISSEFVTVLDLISSGAYGVEGKNLVVDKLKKWIVLLMQNGALMQNQINRWIGFLDSFENHNIRLPYIEKFTKDGEIVRNNLCVTSSYKSLLTFIKSIGTENNTTKSVDDILNNLIYEYEDKEKSFELDNLKNRLIIDCNGDVEKATKLFEKEKYVYSGKIDLFGTSSLLSNIVMFRNEYKVNNETQKLALSLIGFLITNAYEVKNSSIEENGLVIDIDGSVFNVENELNRNKINADINTYLDSEYKGVSKYYYGLLFIITILGLIGALLLKGNSLFMFVLIFIVGLGDIFLIYKIVSESSSNKRLRKIKSDTIYSTIDFILAEYTDYQRALNDNKTKFDELTKYIDSMDLSNYTKVSDGRELNIGE